MVDKNTLSNAHIDNTPPDRGSVVPSPATEPPAHLTQTLGDLLYAGGGGVNPNDHAVAQGGPKPFVELPASQGGSRQPVDPSRAQRAR